MNRRDFVKNAALSAAAIPATTFVKADGMLVPAAIPTPKTAQELRHAIESVFKVIGVADRGGVMMGDQFIRFKTYISTIHGGMHYEGGSLESSYWPTEEQAIAMLWQNVACIREGTQELTEEAKQDGLEPSPGSMIYWRKYPEVRKTDTGIYTARLRAAFL